MKHSRTTKVIAVVLFVMMIVTIVPTSVFASIANWDTENVVFEGTSFGTNGYYNVISKKDYTLVPGAATETEMVLNNSAGTRRQVIHVIEVDPSNPDVSIIPGYYGIDKFAADPTNEANHKAAGVTTMAAYYEDELGYNVVGAMNTALAYDCNAPYSYLVYNGEVLVDRNNNINNFHSGGCSTILCVYKNQDGTCYCELRTNTQGLRGDEWQAIGANFAMVVSNGALVSTSVGRSDDAARSMVGVKEDGTLVLVMNDGRGANNSKGFSSYEEGECMLALGCKWAFNCDGGGSSSFVTRRAGEEDLTMRCVPCDGAERPTLNSVLVVSNVAPTGVFDAAIIESEYDIFAPNTTYTFGVKAVDTHGYGMDMPAEAVWALSDASFGTVTDGVFVSNGKLGEVAVQVKVGDDVFGEKTIQIANPTTLGFAQASTVLPYGKSTTLAFNSLIGEAKVYLDGSSFTFTMSNPNGGTLDGLTFTATEDETITGTVITATYVPTDATYTFSIEFGKGSEIIWDFEDNDLHGFLGQQDAYDWQLAHGVTTPFGYKGDGLNTLINKGQISTDVSSTAFISSAENGGQVHNGQYALGYRFNMTQDAFNQWTYAVIYNVSNINGDVVLRDVANGKKATALGCWVYVPYGFYTAENSGALSLQANLFGGATKETAAQIGLDMKYNGKNLNACTEADIPENRWVYVKADISGYNYVSLVDPLQMNFRSPSVMRMYVKPSVAQVLTYYFDEFTLDYSSAVDDRVPPTISNPQYATADTNIAFDDGAVITDVSAAYTATIADENSGIDPTTAAIYVDGNKVPSTQVVGNTMFCENVALGVGTHKVKFEIADNLGNYTTLTRTIISESEDHYMAARTRIELSGHNDSGETPMPGSVYYIDVKRSYADSTVTAEFTLELSTANEWILDQIVAYKGTEVTYKVNGSEPNKVTFTVENGGAGSDKVMFSIPVRVYNPLLTNGISDGSAVVVSGVSFKAPLSVELTACTVFGSYGNYDKFSVTELDAVHKITRHEHTAHAVEDKTPTCTEAGFTGRTYCDVCQSIVSYGSIVAAVGHAYEFVDDKFICAECGDELDYSGITGLIEASGKYYYAIAGSLATGWQDIDGEWYYFDAETYTTVETLNNGYVTFEFEEDGKLVSGQWYVTDAGRRYYYGPDYYRPTNLYGNAKLVEIDGKTYGFNRNGYTFSGIHVIDLTSNIPARWYIFDEEGAVTGVVNGMFVDTNGKTYYMEDGYKVAKGAVEIDGDIYYFGMSYCALADGEYYIPESMMNGLLPAGNYQIKDFKIVVRNGIYEENGKLYYYENNERVKKGAVEVGGELYYFGMNYYALADGEYYITAEMMNGILPAGNYLIKDAKIIVRNGIYEENGKLYYYENNKRVKKGAVEVGGELYYFGMNYYALADGEYYITAEMMNGILPAGNYLIKDAKIIVRNGIYEENGKLYYYENNERVKKGAVEVGGELYYFGMNYYALADGEYYITAEMMNGILPAGTYKIEDGKIIVRNGIYEENGKLYYYENNVRVRKGAVEVEGDIYYFGMNYYALADGTYYITAEMMNTLLPAGTYQIMDYKIVVDK